MNPKHIPRKLKIFFITIRNCRNWIHVSLARAGLCDGRFPVISRRGPKIMPWVSVRKNWESIFDPLLSDVYAIGMAKSPDVIIDVGANHGAFSVLASFQHPKARVIAFEPNSEIWALLDSNLRANGAIRVEVIHQALAAESREVTFYDSGGGGSSSYVLPGENPRTMTTTSLDKFNWNGARRLFIKLDCEGAEGEIFQWIAGHQADLPEEIDIACEYHPWCPVPLDTTMATLQKAGFSTRCENRFGELYLFASRNGHVGS
jgi:FkbM family methyltransferase